MQNQVRDAAYYVRLKEWHNRVLDQIVGEKKIYEMLQKAQSREDSLQKMRKAVAAPAFVPGIIRMKAAIHAPVFVPQMNQ